MECKNCGLEIEHREEQLRAKWTMPAMWIHVETQTKQCLLWAEPKETND